jgi:hypothetical protein
VKVGGKGDTSVLGLTADLPTVGYLTLQRIMYWIDHKLWNFKQKKGSRFIERVVEV